MRGIFPSYLARTKPALQGRVRGTGCGVLEFRGVQASFQGCYTKYSFLHCKANDKGSIRATLE